MISELKKNLQTRRMTLKTNSMNVNLFFKGKKVSSSKCRSIFKFNAVKVCCDSLEGFNGVVPLQLWRDGDPFVVHFPVKRPSHGVPRLSVVAEVVVVNDVDHRTHDRLPVLGNSVWETQREADVLFFLCFSMRDHRKQKNYISNTAGFRFCILCVGVCPSGKEGSEEYLYVCVSVCTLSTEEGLPVCWRRSLTENKFDKHLM